MAALKPTSATRSRNHGQIRDLLDFLGEKWGLPLVILLAQRPYRFGEIRKLVPEISQRMLTETLRGLTRSGIVTRTVFPTRPPSVEYALTAVGLDFLNSLVPLAVWYESQRAYISEAKIRYDAEMPRATPAV
jgi:DNA-binding HxlR family transcriptional regulator